MKIFMILLMSTAFLPVQVQALEYTNIDSFYFEHSIIVSGDPVTLQKIMLGEEKEWWNAQLEGKSPDIRISIERNVKRGFVKYDITDKSGKKLFSRPLHFSQRGKYHSIDGMMKWQDTHPFMQFRIMFYENEDGKTRIKLIAKSYKQIDEHFAPKLVEAWQYHFRQFQSYMILKNSEKLRKYLSKD